MTALPDVSVVIPVRNAADTLPEALQSCRVQTLESIEIIIVNDGSDDSSGVLADHAARQDTRIRVIHFRRPQGLVAALQTGCSESRGHLLARMDADDRSYPGRLQQQVDLLARNPQAAVCSCRIKITGSAMPERPRQGFQRYERWLNELTEPEDIARERFIESPVVHPTVLMRRDVLAEVGGYRDTDWAEDYDLWLRMLEAGHQVIKVPEVLYEWRDSPHRLTRTDKRYAQHQFLRAKAHYLGRQPEVAHAGVSLCGAGPIGKRLARCFKAEGIRVKAFYEVHPRRVGRYIHDIPVLHHGEMRPDGTVLINAVGLPGARNRVRALAADAGYVEGHTFWCAA